MFTRLINPPEDKSFFLLGPRGTGKTTWERSKFPEAVYVDLLESEISIEGLLRCFLQVRVRREELQFYFGRNGKTWTPIGDT